MASGAIFGPQLFFASGIRSAALGRYLNDQIVRVVPRSAEQGHRREPRPAAIARRPDPDAAPPKPEVWIPVSEKRPWHCQIHYDPINFTTPGGEFVDERLLVFIQWFGMVEAEEHNRVFFIERPSPI